MRVSRKAKGSVNVINEDSHITSVTKFCKILLLKKTRNTKRRQTKTDKVEKTLTRREGNNKRPKIPNLKKKEM